MRLPRFRFSLLGLMALVAYTALGCAALRYSTELWASGIFTLAVLLQMIAVLCVVLRREQARAAWIGFLVFGGGYLLLTNGPWPQADLITHRGLSWLQQKMRPEAATDYVRAFPNPNSHALYAYKASGAVFQTSQLLLSSGAVVNGPPVAQLPFTRIGHALLSPLFGLLGVLVASWLFAARRSEAS